ncbi:hypothetical protein CEXT_729241 [Caerostris extrusa]|uniref:Uncharacterized protein n=1 Tax=Caerostris extrusa TaxID=172846 RepID=A0AAV4WHQ2_CAEEX|nr:hypothetical protein CEXT_729241 [Caerostris extrusa]
MGRKAAETACNINQTVGPDTCKTTREAAEEVNDSRQLHQMGKSKKLDKFVPRNGNHKVHHRPPEVASCFECNDRASEAFDLREEKHAAAPLPAGCAVRCVGHLHGRLSGEIREIHRKTSPILGGSRSQISLGKEFKEDEVLRYNFDIRKGPVFIKWFENAETNIAYNALDRNVKEGLGDKIAYLW